MSLIQLFLFLYPMTHKKAFHPNSQLLADPVPQDELMPEHSVDCVILGFEDEKLKVLLVQHPGGAGDGKWALPGDFLRKVTGLEEMPYELLKRLTGIEHIFVEQLGAFGAIDRVDFRRVITVAYYALISPQEYTLKIGSRANNVLWFNVKDVPKLIFDHDEILDFAIDRLRKDLNYKPIWSKLLSNKFTLTQLQKLFEAILDKKLDTRNFRRKILKNKTLKDTGKFDRSVNYRAPKLYSFDKKAYKKQLNNSFTS